MRTVSTILSMQDLSKCPNLITCSEERNRFQQHLFGKNVMNYTVFSLPDVVVFGSRFEFFIEYEPWFSFEVTAQPWMMRGDGIPKNVP